MAEGRFSLLLRSWGCVPWGLCSGALGCRAYPFALGLALQDAVPARSRSGVPRNVGCRARSCWGFLCAQGCRARPSVLGITRRREMPRPLIRHEWRDWCADESGWARLVPKARCFSPKNRHRERFVLTKIVHDGELLAFYQGESFTMANSWPHDGEFLAFPSGSLTRA